eukprot:3500350-Rhodomonas_salina.2
MIITGKSESRPAAAVCKNIEMKGETNKTETVVEIFSRSAPLDPPPSAHAHDERVKKGRRPGNIG